MCKRWPWAQILVYVLRVCTSAVLYAHTVQASRQDGHLVRSLKGHGHWVNTLALSAEFALRTGAFDHTGAAPAEPAAAQAQALQRCALDRC